MSDQKQINDKLIMTERLKDYLIESDDDLVFRAMDEISDRLEQSLVRWNAILDNIEASQEAA